MPKSKDTHPNKHGYSWYTEEQLDEYYNELIGMILQILNITLHFLSTIIFRRARRHFEGAVLH